MMIISITRLAVTRGDGVTAGKKQRVYTTGSGWGLTRVRHAHAGVYHPPRVTKIILMAPRGRVA